ncbi:hypothetical protein CC2G_003892 [Coprinopsis cinerea AmutBmut pab1-1]|nr:hypothetical protein CC2G_003892 [Coprinopsis cinerea AmutBmut pab1-1]
MSFGVEHWSHRPATQPPTGSLCIRWPLLERPIVVFPTHPHRAGRPVSIYDVFTAVYHATSSLNRRTPNAVPGTSSSPNTVTPNLPLPYPPTSLLLQPEISTYRPNGRQRHAYHHGGGVVSGGAVPDLASSTNPNAVSPESWNWVGLTPSTTERDVWILNIIR